MQIDQVQYDRIIQSFFSWLVTPVGLIVFGLVIILIVGLSIVSIING